MANYTTATSDKSRKKALRLLLYGGIGLHLFYVGRIKAGIFRLVIGCFLWFAFLVCVIYGITDDAVIFLEAVFMLVLLVAINLPDFVRLMLGSFRDNVGAALRD